MTDTHDTNGDLNGDIAAQLSELTRRIEQLERENAQLRGTVPPATASEASSSDEQGGVSRRRAILGLGAAAAAAATVAVTGASPAGAALGQPVLQGQSNTFSGSLATTVTNSTGRAFEVHGNDDYGIYAVGNNAAGVRSWGYASEGLIATGLDIPAGTGKEGVVGLNSNAGYAAVRGSNSKAGYGVLGQGGTGVRGEGNDGAGVSGRSTKSGASGVVGTQTTSLGYGVYGEGPTGVYGVGNPGVLGESLVTNGIGVLGRANSGGIGGRFTGTRAAVHLVPRTVAGAPTTGFHNRGELVVDNTGKLFICTANGTPGSWARVNVTAV